MVNESKSRNEAEIRKLIDDWATAFRAKDVERIMSFYAQDIVAYDIVPPLQYAGAEEYRKDWETMLAMCDGPLGYETRDMKIVAGEDTAFCHCLNHVTGKMTDGKAFDNWMRVTVGYQKIDGKWLVVHEHVSAPIDMESGKGLFDLKP
jgi:uncharacterized protein (TIGR02246 family)